MKTIEIPGMGEGWADRSVKVEYDNEQIVVTWLCGDTFKFSKDSLALQLASFDATCKVPDAFLDSRDDRQRRFVVRLVEGNFTADTMFGHNQMKVDWVKLRAALNKAVRNEPKRKPRSKSQVAEVIK